MSGLLSPTTRRFAALLAALMLVALATAPVGAGGPPGNNGTVKIHSGAKADDTDPVVANEPHVSCPFHAHFFFADSGQGSPDGFDWWIVPQAPGGDGTAAGDYIANGDGEYWTGPIDTLGEGHYKLYWTGRNGQNIKHKTFWVDGSCEGPPPPPCEDPLDVPPCDQG